MRKTLHLIRRIASESDAAFFIYFLQFLHRCIFVRFCIKYFNDYSVKSPTSRHACMVVEEELYDTPHNEEEVGQGSHEFRIVGRIVGAAMQRNNP